MAENLKPGEPAEQTPASEPEILTNDYGATRDSTVVIEEETRTVLLTDNETIVIEKQPVIDVVPKNRARRIYAGMWGNTEIATVGLGLLAVLSVIILYVLVVMPAQKELEKNRAERNRLETELTTARAKYGDVKTTQEGVAKVVGSAVDFESRFLPIATNGRAALYQNINGLIAAYNLVNTSGPEYTPLELGGGQQTEANEGRAKYQSIFPGVYVTMTVEGSYQNLRRFVREIETSDQFVVISAVELAPAENNNQNGDTQPSVSSVKITPMQQPQAQQPYSQPQDFMAPGIPNQRGQQQQQSPSMMTQPQTATTIAKPRGVTHGETVSLHLEMAAYFRRAGAAPAIAGNGSY